MDKKVITIDEIKKKFIDEFPSSFDLSDIYKFANSIEWSINELYNLALTDRKYSCMCMDEQLKILSNIYMSFIKVCFSQIDEYDGSEESNRILYSFACELYKIYKNLPDLDKLKNETDTIVLKLEDKN